MIESPVLIIGCARSGTSLLYNILAETQALWSIGHESKEIIERYHAPATKGWESGALTAEDLTAESREFILRQFERQSAPGNYWRRIDTLRRVVNHSGLYTAVKRHGRSDAVGSGASSALPGSGLHVVRALARLRNRMRLTRPPIRLLEKTPENCLRLPFLAALFPDARIIFLTRSGRTNVHSLVEGWRQPHLFPGYQTPVAVTSSGQTRGRWAFTLIPGWRELVNRPLEEICARQWVASNEAVLEYSGKRDARPILRVRYEDLVDTPDTTLAQIAGFLDLAPRQIPSYGQALPEVNVISRPDNQKWLREAEAISSIESVLSPTMTRLGYNDPLPDRTAS